MKKPLFLTLGTALIAGAAFAIAGLGTPASTATIGAPAPAWTLTDSNGKTHSLSDFRGKVVVLEWTNHQCPFVVKHYSGGNMQALQKWAKERGVVWLSIVSSAPGKQGHVTAEQANALMKEKGFHSAAMLLDPTGVAGRAYGARTTPHMFIINERGVLVYNGAIDDKPTPSAADIPGSTNFVKNALEEHLAGKPISRPTSQPYGCSVKY